MATQLINCPQCGGLGSFDTDTINLTTGKQVPGTLVSYLAILLGFALSVIGGWFIVEILTNPGITWSDSLTLCGFLFVIATSLLGWGGNRLNQHKGEKAKVYYYTCVDCKHEWNEWEQGVNVTEKMVQEWYLKDIETEKGNERTRAIHGLGDVGDENAIDPLIEILGEGGLLKINDRIAAAEALGKIGNPAATEALIQALGDKNLTETAARSLGKIGDPRALEPLERIAQGKNKRVCAAAEEAITQIKVAHPEPVV